MKKKKIVIEASYFGNIRKCLHLNKENNYKYINSEIVSRNQFLLKTTDNIYMTGYDYISGKNNFLNANPTKEGELFVDEKSLVKADSYIYEDKIPKKSLHL